MIETVMLLAIGALFACLGAIALLPAIWRRAVRLTRAELMATLPVTPGEFAAEKDQIRAAAALEQRRIELRAEATDATLHAARAEIGDQIALIQRHVATIADRDSEIVTLKDTLAARNEQIAGLDETVAGLERERDNLATNLSASRIANQALDQENLNLRQAAESRQGRIEEQDRQIDSLHAKVAEVQAMAGTLRAELQQRTEELRLSSRSLREASTKLSILERKHAVGETLAGERATQLAELQEERLRFIDEAGEIKRARDAARVDATAAASQVESLGKRVAELEAALEKSRGAGNDLARDLMRTIDTLRQEKRQADDELSAMRLERVRIEEQDRQIDGLHKKAAEAQAVTGALRAELQQRTEELNVLSRSLREASARFSTLERKHAAGEALAGERAAQLSEFQEERLRYLDEASELKRARDAARVEASSAASQLESLGRRLAELEATLEKSRGGGNDLVRDLMRTIDTLRQEKHQADNELSAMRFEKARIEALLARQRPAPRPVRETPTPAE